MSSMRSSRGRGGRRLNSDMNVVPYIDVMLVLLVIFMVTAPMITPGIIDLPNVGRASNVPQVPLEIQITEDGELSWRKREPGAEFQTVPRNAVAQTILDNIEPEQPVVIAAHGKVPYETVVELMDRLRSNGVNRLGLLVEQQQSSEPVDTTPATGS